MKVAAGIDVSKSHLDVSIIGREGEATSSTAKRG